MGFLTSIYPAVLFNMKTQNIIGAILILFGTAILWFFTEFGFGHFAAYAGDAVGSSMVFILVLLLFLAITPLRKKTAIILVIGIVWFGSTATISFDLYKNGVKERETGHATLELFDTFSRSLSDFSSKPTGFNPAIFWGYLVK